jgi:hypothetical protein
MLRDMLAQDLRDNVRSPLDRSAQACEYLRLASTRLLNQDRQPTIGRLNSLNELAQERRNRLTLLLRHQHQQLMVSLIQRDSHSRLGRGHGASWLSGAQ